MDWERWREALRRADGYGGVDRYLEVRVRPHFLGALSGLVGEVRVRTSEGAGVVRLSVPRILGSVSGHVLFAVDGEERERPRDDLAAPMTPDWESTLRAGMSLLSLTGLPIVDLGHRPEEERARNVSVRWATACALHDDCLELDELALACWRDRHPGG